MRYERWNSPMDLAWALMVGTTQEPNSSNSFNVKFVKVLNNVGVACTQNIMDTNCRVHKLTPPLLWSHVNWTNHWCWKPLLSSLETKQGHLGPCLPKYPHHLKMRWNHHYLKSLRKRFLKVWNEKKREKKKEDLFFI